MISACTEQKPVRIDDADPEASTFLLEKLDDEVAAGLHYKEPGYCFRQIRNTIPQKWWRYAVEGFYYKIPERKDTSGFISNWLDTAQVVLPDQNVKSFIQMIRGNEYVGTGNYSAAINCMNESLSLALECNQLYRANDARRYLARALMFHGDYPRAVSLLLQVNEFFSDKPLFEHQVRIFETKMELARVFQISGDFSKAYYWSQQACNSAVANSGQQVTAAEYLTRALLNLNKPDSALLVIQDSEIKRKTLHIIADSASGHFLMGKTLAELRQYHAAIPRLQLGLSSNVEVNNRQKIAEIETALADCYMGLGQTETALNYYLRILQITPDTSKMASIHYKVSDIFEKKGQIHNALYHYKMGASCFRTFFNADKDRATGRIESQVALEREANKVILLSEQQKTRESRFISLILALLLSSVLLFFLFDRQRRKRSLLEKENELLEAQQIIQQQNLQIANATLVEKTAELEVLQNLINLKNQLILKLEQKLIKSAAENPENIQDSTDNTPYSTIPQADINDSSSQNNGASPPLRMLTDRDWQEFRDSFEQEFPYYISRLKSAFPKITNNEVRLFIFIKVGLESSQIASISGISPETVYQNRYRLRQKLNLEPDASLEWFVKDF
jgi:tetratricopeptide (TPR) repeat protein